MHTSKTNPLITVQSGNGYRKLKCAEKISLRNPHDPIV
jgi:hypothetical protein